MGPEATGIDLLRDPTAFAVVAASFGLVIGSFLNVVIFRLPRGESIVFPPSHCPGCERPIRPWDNIPVLSYLVLRGRCRTCDGRISPRYPAVEATTGCVFALIAWHHGLAWMTPLLMLFAAGLIVAALIDFDTQIIPDEISIGGLVLGFVAVPLARWLEGVPFSDALAYSVVGAAIGGGSLWAVGFLHARICVAMGRSFEHWPEEGEPVPRPTEADYWLWFPGIGLGDVKLLAMIGVFLGPWGVLVTILAASVAGLVLGVIWAAVTRSWRTPFGFAPAIALGALLALLVPTGPGLLALF